MYLFLIKIIIIDYQNGWKYIHDFWNAVLKEINDILGQTVNISPLSCILGLHNPSNISPNLLKLLKILLFCARRCILLTWVSEEPPSITQWISSVLVFMPLEALSFYLREEPFHFYKVWSPFIAYLGPESLQAITAGFCGLAWKQ